MKLEKDESINKETIFFLKWPFFSSDNIVKQKALFFFPEGSITCEYI